MPGEARLGHRMNAVDFYKLPRAIQDRFVGSVMSGFPPAPMLATKGGTPVRWVWFGLAAICLVALVVLTRIGYGSLDSALSLHGPAALVLYVAFVFGLAFGLVSAFAQIVRERALPYGAGVYLFPACLIDARSDQFKVYSTQDLASVDAAGSVVRVTFGGAGQFSFTAADPAQAAQLVLDIQAARDRAMHARATEEPAELVAVDPLHNPRFSSPVGPRDPHEHRLPPWKRFGWAVALGVAVVFAPTTWTLRNGGSDKTMFARATKADETGSYRAYLERGKRHHEEVSTILLPRAELRDAIAVGTVEALVAYKASHPDSQIAGEVDAALRAAMLVELEKAKEPMTLAALDAFAKSYPDHGVETELRAAIHAVYARQLDAFKVRAATKDKAVVPFVERLFAWVEKHGAKVEIRFRRKKSDSMGRADQFVGKTPSFMGEISYPSRYFDEKHSVRREQLLGKVLAPRFDEAFGAELFDVGVGASLGPEAEGLPEVTVPTLFLSYGAEWSGHSYVANRPRGSYVGVLFPFEALFVIPGDGKPIKLKSDIVKQPALQLLKDEDPPLGPGAAEEKIYDVAATDAFQVFGNRVFALFFKAEKGSSAER